MDTDFMDIEGLFDEINKINMQDNKWQQYY